MATYSELFDLRYNNTALLNKVAVAATKKAQALLGGVTPTPNQVLWAKNTLVNPLEVAQYLYNYVLAANSSATVAQINSATDTTIQNNVDTAVDAIIAGGAV